MLLCQHGGMNKKSPRSNRGLKNKIAKEIKQASYKKVAKLTKPKTYE